MQASEPSAGLHGKVSAETSNNWGRKMRAALFIIAAVLLLGVAALFVWPQMHSSEARQAAQALVAGAEPAKQQVGSAAEKSGKLSGAGNGVKVAVKSDPKHGDMKWIVSD